jgi:hypothetical protein
MSPSRMKVIYLAHVWVHCVVQEGCGRLILTKEDRVQVMLSHGQARVEMIKGSL